MESNRDEAKRCLAIARGALALADYDKAARFASKSSSLYASPQASALTAQVQAARRATSPTTPHHNKPPRTHTDAQAAAVAGVMRAKPSDLYTILGVPHNASQEDIKRAYRKRALSLHPDKNTAPRAEEAFKRLSHAMQVLSDATKRNRYDAIGDDDGASPSPSLSRRHSSASHRQNNNHYYANEVSPDELFNMFFGGAGVQGPSPFGHPVRVRTFNYGSAPNRRNYSNQRSHETQPHHPQAYWLSFLPAILLLFMFISFLSSDNYQTPLYAIEPFAPYTINRFTATAKLPYYVSTERTSGPAAATTLAFDLKFPPDSVALSRLEIRLERAIFTKLEDACGYDKVVRARYTDLASSWLRSRADRQKYSQKARDYPMANCKVLFEARLRGEARP